MKQVYKSVRAQSQQDLDARVNQWLVRGWQAQGGMVVVQNPESRNGEVPLLYFQAITKIKKAANRK